MIISVNVGHLLFNNVIKFKSMRIIIVHRKTLIIRTLCCTTIIWCLKFHEIFFRDYFTQFSGITNITTCVMRNPKCQKHIIITVRPNLCTGDRHVNSALRDSRPAPFAAKRKKMGEKKNKVFAALSPEFTTLTKSTGAEFTNWFCNFDKQTSLIIILRIIEFQCDLGRIIKR